MKITTTIEAANLEEYYVTLAQLQRGFVQPSIQETSFTAAEIAKINSAMTEMTDDQARQLAATVSEGIGGFGHSAAVAAADTVVVNGEVLKADMLKMGGALPEEPKTRKPRTKKAEVVKEEPKPVPAEAKAQDEADEEAESEAEKAADEPLSHDDVRNALGTYVSMYGMPAAQEDWPKLAKEIFGESANIFKVSDVPNDQDSLRKVVDGLREIAAKNRFGRAVVGG